MTINCSKYCIQIQIIAKVFNYLPLVLFFISKILLNYYDYALYSKSKNVLPKQYFSKQYVRRLTAFQDKMVFSYKQLSYNYYTIVLVPFILMYIQTFLTSNYIIL